MIERVAGRQAARAAMNFLWLEVTAWWSWSDSNQQPKCYGTWLVSDQLTWSDTPSRSSNVSLFCLILLANTRTHRQSVMEHGSSPTNYPGRKAPFRISATRADVDGPRRT